MLRTVVISTLVALSTLHAYAQNALGALHSNYTPTNGVFINPSSMLDAKVWLDINIVGVGSYANNNLVYLNDQRGATLIKEAIRQETRLTEDDVQFNQGRKRYHAYNRNFVAGPAGVWSSGDHAAGLAIGGRSYTAVRKIPDYIAQFIENGVPPYTQQHDIDYSLQNVRAASLNFGEIKGSYAYTFLKRKRNMFMGGISISKFFPIAGGAANIYDFNFNVDNDSLAVLYNVETDLMYTPEAKFNAKGGMGFDIGFTYQKMLGEAASYFPNSSRMGCRSLPYKYKVGVSIMDIGSIKFAEEDIQFAGYNFSNFDWQNYADEEIDENNATNLFEQAEQDITQGNVRKPNKIRLPTFVSAQFDYNAWASRIYINATWIQGIPPGKRKFGLRHANSLSVTPRFESPFIDIAMPFSLYEYRYPQLGASLRLGPITIGTDKLLNYIAKTDIYGADIYFYLKIPFRYHPKCKGRFSPTKFQNGQKHKKYRPCEAYG